uniref:hypothetical protein n=1 Tax=Paracraurococcus lichenis TaxID=3064888 RepID=UPI0038D20478
MRDFCCQARPEFILGVITSSTLRQHVLALEQSTAVRQAARPGSGKLRRYKAFLEGARS